MGADIMNILSKAIAAAMNFFIKTLTSTGLSGIYISFIVVWLSVKYLLAPLLFSVGSDKAKKKDKEEK